MSSSRKWKVSEEEREVLAAAQAQPLGIRSILAAARQAPTVIPELGGAIKEGALQGIAGNSRLICVLSALRTRAAVPNLGAGATWGDEDLFLDALRPHLAPEKRALDLGCGAGRIARHVAPLVAHVECVDASRMLLAEAEEELAGFPNVTLTLNHGFQITGIADGAFDLVYAQGLFAYLDPLQALALLLEVRRVLVPGGEYVINFQTIERAPAVRRAIEVSRMGASRGRFGASYYRPYAAEQIRAWYRMCDLTVEDELTVDRDDGFYPTTFVGRATG